MSALFTPQNKFFRKEQLKKRLESFRKKGGITKNINDWTVVENELIAVNFSEASGFNVFLKILCEDSFNIVQPIFYQFGNSKIKNIAEYITQCLDAGKAVNAYIIANKYQNVSVAQQGSISFYYDYSFNKKIEQEYDKLEADLEALIKRLSSINDKRMNNFKSSEKLKSSYNECDDSNINLLNSIIAEKENDLRVLSPSQKQTKNVINISGRPQLEYYIEQDILALKAKINRLTSQRQRIDKDILQIKKENTDLAKSIHDLHKEILNKERENEDYLFNELTRNAELKKIEIEISFILYSSQIV